MTRNDMTNQIYDLSNGIINGEKLTKTLFTKMVKDHFDLFNELTLKLTLPDGDWFCKIHKWDNKEYDYFIPDTREQEKKYFN